MHDPRLVGPGVAPLSVDGTEAGLGIEVVHEGAGTIVDGLSAEERVVGIQHAVTLLEGVCEHFARLVAHWQVLGFVHGVLNTDNCSVHGLTIDYGPFAFLEAFDPNFTPNSSDSTRRYAFGAQANIMAENCARLAMALEPLLAALRAAEAAAKYALVRVSGAARVAMETALRRRRCSSRGLLPPWRSSRRLSSAILPRLGAPVRHLGSSWRSWASSCRQVAPRWRPAGPT